MTNENYMTDAAGRLIPKETVKDVDLERNDLVNTVVQEALKQSEQLRKFKLGIMGDIDKFAQRSAKKYGVHLGGKKGNITLLSFDGKYKIMRAISEHITFDERLQAAKSLIDSCIQEWTDGSRDEIKVLINDAFSVNKQGKIDRNRILGLRRLKINHPKWRKAMDAISESVTVVGSKEYVRIYERAANGLYKQINLDMASI